ncbi:hypothetical protein [Microcoleus sp. FACHB-68]|nr:hypothetical protein [Microcoleus sp. FACHB-68]
MGHWEWVKASPTRTVGEWGMGQVLGILSHSPPLPLSTQHSGLST